MIQSHTQTDKDNEDHHSPIEKRKKQTNNKK